MAVFPLLAVMLGRIEGQKTTEGNHINFNSERESVRATKSQQHTVSVLFYFRIPKQFNKLNSWRVD